MQDSTPAELLDIRAAAEFLRVSETSLRRWTNAGLLPCLRIGGRRERRFRRADLLAFAGAAGGSAATRVRTHFCGFYTSDLSRARAAAGFLVAALRPRGLAWLVAAKEVQRAVVGLLERDRLTIRRDLKAGRLLLTEFGASPAAQFESWRERLRSAVAAGVSHVRMVGDVSGGAFGRLPFAEILECEAEYDRTISRVFPLAMLCQYDARVVSGLDVAGLLQHHDAGLPGGYRSQH